MHIGNILRQLYGNKGISQTKAAKLLGLRAQGSFQRRLLMDNPSIEILRETLDLIDYEIVIQPKRQGRRADGQIAITKELGDEEK